MSKSNEERANGVMKSAEKQYSRKALAKLRYPLIQGGMGIGISMGGLAGAVAREGGMGVISTANIGLLGKPG